DKSLLEDLELHLNGLKRQGLISIWHDYQIPVGADKARAIDERLERASVVLLLVSPDFLALDHCYEIEMQRAIERHEAGLARVVPIIIRSCDWNHAPFAKLQSLPLDGKPVTIWENRDLAWTDVVAGIRRAIEDLSLLAVNAPKIDLPPVWNVPDPRNPFFTGQEDVLTQLADALKAGQPAALSQPQAINGLGGIGKTQIASEYGYQYHQDYQAVLWTPADKREALISGYVTIAGLLNLPEKDEQDQSITINAVFRWLATHTKWLLILDSADE